MKIDIKATNLDLTPALRVYIDEKIGVLAKFLKRWDMEGGVEVWVEVARTTRHHQKGPVFRAEADIRLPGKILRAEDAALDIRVAIDRVRDKLKREIEKYKELKKSS
jgi:ribosomal subunit interface protein